MAERYFRPQPPQLRRLWAGHNITRPERGRSHSLRWGLVIQHGRDGHTCVVLLCNKPKKRDGHTGDTARAQHITQTQAGQITQIRTGHPDLSHSPSVLMLSIHDSDCFKFNERGILQDSQNHMTWEGKQAVMTSHNRHTPSIIHNIQQHQSNLVTRR